MSRSRPKASNRPSGPASVRDVLKVPPGYPGAWANLDAPFQGSRFRPADLLLNSFPHDAGATCVSRTAASLFRAVGLPHLMTDSREACEILAFRPATEPDLLAAVRRRLADRDMTPLFDMPRFAADRERLLNHMDLLQRTDVPPSSFAIELG